MAQAPATPKGTRLMRRLQAALFGPARLARAPALQPSERAALELAHSAHAVPRARATQVHFLIPLVGPAHVGDWQAVTTYLAQTLAGFQRQSNPNWTATICCQVAPDLPEALNAEPRIRHLPYTDTTPGNDKWRKLACLAEDIASRADAPSYVMSFDADDLLHPQAVADMLDSDAPGHLVSLGYVLDKGADALALAGPPTLALPLRKPFWKLCGSCAAVYHDPSNPASAPFLKAMTQHEHRMFPYLCALAGLPLRPLPDARVLYLLNHGENFGARRGRVSFKARFVQRFRVTDPDALATVARDYGLKSAPSTR